MLKSIDWGLIIYIGLAFLFLWWGINWKTAGGLCFLALAICQRMPE